jgi:ribonuclease T2
MRATMARRARLLGLSVAVAAFGLVAFDVSAQQRVPYRERPDANERSDLTNQPGVFDYYLLALSWSPTYCAGITDGRYDPQCHSRDRRYAFVLHGLWPQYEQRWPYFCRSPDNGFVPSEVADRMLDIMPSKRLIFHEYRKHGTCSGLGVEGYFDLARRMFESVNIPQRYVALEDDRLTVSPDELIREFMEANPKLARDQIVVECGGPGNRLKEVRICFNKGGGLRACGRNEDQKRLCSAERMYVPPVRISAQGAPPQRSAPQRPAPEKRLLQPEPKPGVDFLPGPR